MKETNMCDYCQKGEPLEDGYHVYTHISGAKSYSVCTKKRYIPEVSEWEERVHAMIQEEIAARVPYETKFAELALSRGMETLESRLCALIVSVRNQTLEQAAKTNDILVGDLLWIEKRASTGLSITDDVKALEKNMGSIIRSLKK